MFKQTLKTMAFMFCVSSLGISISPAKASSSTETACYKFVQNNIPWNYNGKSRWNPTNIKRLCRGASTPSEPGRCFDRAMHGNVYWGGGTRWKWKNALNLCAGTTNASWTIDCFSKGVNSGSTWQNAIATCKS